MRLYDSIGENKSYKSFICVTRRQDQGRNKKTREEGAGVMFDEHQENGMNRQALFTDETQDYRRPEEPDAGETVNAPLSHREGRCRPGFLY